MGLPVTVLATYRPKKGKEARFFTLLKRHWPTLKKAGLVAPTPPRIWRASDKRTRRVYFVESVRMEGPEGVGHRPPDARGHGRMGGPMLPLLENKGPCLPAGEVGEHLGLARRDIVAARDVGRAQRRFGLRELPRGFRSGAARGSSGLISNRRITNSAPGAVARRAGGAGDEAADEAGRFRASARTHARSRSGASLWRSRKRGTDPHCISSSSSAPRVSVCRSAPVHRA